MAFKFRKILFILFISFLFLTNILLLTSCNNKNNDYCIVTPNGMECE